MQRNGLGMFLLDRASNKGKKEGRKRDIGIGAWLMLLVLMHPVVASTAYEIPLDASLQEHSFEIDALWATAEKGSLSGQENVSIKTRILRHPQEKGAVIFVSGRTETFLKYKEFVYTLYQNGYSVYIHDHRGQGLSDRLLSEDSEKGYVEDFEFYVDDLKAFYDKEVAKQQHPRLFMLSHSMGGTIATRYAQKYPSDVNGIVLASPMLGMVMPIPDWLACGLSATIGSYERLVHAEPAYAFGQKPYHQPPVAQAPKDMTHSRERIEAKYQLYNRHEHARLGGVTFQWLSEACISIDRIFQDISHVNIPVLLLQSGEDVVVDNKAQALFCEKLKSEGKTECLSGGPVVIEGAFHELFMETDDYRIPAIAKTLEFMENH